MENLTFEFAKYTEITDLAFEVNPEYKNSGYVRFFICPDVHDFWFVRILKGYRNDDTEGYVNDEDNYILERNNISMDKKAEKLTISKVKQIIEGDDFSNYDLQQGYDIDELIDIIDNGFGILNRKDPS